MKQPVGSGKSPALGGERPPKLTFAQSSIESIHEIAVGT